MNALVLVALGNAIIWGCIVVLLFWMAARERELAANLTDLEARLDRAQGDAAR